MKIALLLSVLFVGSAAQAQLTLSGSGYFQSFDSVSTGLPLGWEIDSNATATSKGSAMLFNVNPIQWKLPATTSGKGLNFAAKNGFTDPGTSTAIQAAATNRAMGLRQIANTDSQIAFTVVIAQTTGLINLSMSFLLQSLDTSSARVTTWEVQYGIGANPTSFTTIPATGTLTTGGSGNFSSNLINVSFGAALDNINTPLVIRIATLHKTVGSNNRASSAIDSLTINWTGAAAPSYRPVIASVSPINGSTNVVLNAPLNISFDRPVIGNVAGNIYLHNQTDNTIQTMAGNTAIAAGNTVTIPSVTLLYSKNYYVTFDSSAFDTAGFKSYGLYDSTSWKFSTVSAPVGTFTSLNEQFDSSCPNLPAGWTRQNVDGPAQQWNCYEPSASSGNFVMRMNGFSSGNNLNEDWLITPKLNFSANANPMLYFKLWKRFKGDEVAVMLSTDYDGTSAPATGSWTDLNIIASSPADTGFFKIYSQNLTSNTASPFYLAFQYTSTTTTGYDARLDSVVVINVAGSGIGNVGSQINTLDVQVVGYPNTNNLNINFQLESAAHVNIHIFDLAGRKVYRNVVVGMQGKNSMSLQPQSLQPGMYVIKISNGVEQGIARTFLH